MGRLIGAFLIVLLLVCPALTSQPHFSLVVSATDANTNTDLTAGGLYRANSILLVNDGPDEIYFDLTNGVAAVSGASINPGESIAVTSGGGAYPLTNLGLICAPGETASVRIFAFPSE